MKRIFMFVAMVATAVFSVTHAFAMGDIAQAVSALPAALPAALAAGAFALANPLASRPRAVHAAPRADASDPKKMLAELQAAFEDFKKTNDEKLKSKADVVLDEKVQRIDAAVGNFQAAIDDLNTKIAAAQLSSGDRKLRDPEYSEAFKAHFAKGAVSASLNKGADAEGGYLAPIEWDRTIVDKLVEISPMRQIAQVQNISTAGFKRLFNNRGTGSGWVGETAARPETTTATFSPLTFTPGEIYANPAATQQLLDDAEIDLEAWLSSEVETEFAYQEGIAFVSGNGTNKPNGFLTYVTGAANAATHPFGAIQLKTAAAGAAVTSDELIDLVQMLPQALQQNARFVLNRNALTAVRKLKDGQGGYLWQPSFQLGQASQLLGYPITEMAAMPNIAINAVPIAFGDFRRGYLIVDRMGVRVLRDPYTNKPYVMFYTTKRVGGGVQDPQAIKALKMAAA
jgi:HK97 family phage major capsid protein